MHKIILITIAIAGLSVLSAQAKDNTKEVCKMSKKGNSCYHTKYSENFKVCKNNGGYYICGENPTTANSTKHKNYAMAPRTEEAPMQQGMNDYAAVTPMNDALTAPQSQSYPSAMTVNSMGNYEGSYPQKHYMKVTYIDNVAEETRAPYEGLPSPQYDGPQKNAERNLNANNPNVDLAPITGKPE